MRFSSPRTVLDTNGTRNIFIALKLLQSIQTNIKKKTDFNTFKISIFVIQDFFFIMAENSPGPKSLFYATFFEFSFLKRFLILLS